MTSPHPAVLPIHYEPHALSAMRMALDDEFECLTAVGSETGLRLMQDEWPQVVICHQRMPGPTGVEFLGCVRERWPDAVRVIITGPTDVTAMTQAINVAGVHQYLTKPWHPDQLLMAARNGTRLFKLARANGRMALEMRYLALTTQGKLDKSRVAEELNLSRAGLRAKFDRYGITDPVVPGDIGGERLICVWAFLDGSPP